MHVTYVARTPGWISKPKRVDSATCRNRWCHFTIQGRQVVNLSFTETFKNATTMPGQHNSSLDVHLMQCVGHGKKQRLCGGSEHGIVAFDILVLLLQSVTHGEVVQTVL